MATAYYQACQYTYEPIFFAWRNKVNELRANGIEDMSAGYHNPWIQSRGISSMEEINYNVTYKKESLKMFLLQASRNCRKRYKYYMNAQEDEVDLSSIENNSVSSRSPRKLVTQKLNSTISKTDARARAKIRKNNPEYAFLEDAIKKQEEQF